jgi:iron complex outermembrane receptor protein
MDIIETDALCRSGLTETNTLLGALLPSFNFPQPSITDGTDHVRPAQLRGLAPDHTLVFVNGKRRHSSALLNLNGSSGRGSSAVDLNAIPANAIERIEILRDGAAAQYGSDAIAGVINIVLKMLTLVAQYLLFMVPMSRVWMV